MKKILIFSLIVTYIFGSECKKNNPGTATIVQS